MEPLDVAGWRETMKWWRRRESNPRPRVRPRGTLHAYPLLMFRGQREETAKNRWSLGPELSRDGAPSRRPIASLFNGVWPPTTRRGQGRRSQRIRLRERTEYPQLTDVPSDLRVNGARHASRESLPPSKPCRPLKSGLAERTGVFAKRLLSPFIITAPAGLRGQLPSSTCSLDWGCTASSRLDFLGHGPA